MIVFRNQIRGNAQLGSAFRWLGTAVPRTLTRVRILHSLKLMPPLRSELIPNILTNEFFLEISPKS